MAVDVAALVDKDRGMISRRIFWDDEIYQLEQTIKARGDGPLLHDWRRLQTSDHFYYMCTKYFSDGDVHKYFNPYESPYDSYINFMNVLDNVRSRARN